MKTRFARASLLVVCCLLALWGGAADAGGFCLAANADDPGAVPRAKRETTGAPASPVHAGKKPVAILYDDDCTYDVDCVYTLSALHRWIDAGDVRVLAFLADSGTPYSTPIFRIFEDYYGHRSIPIGAYKGNRVRSGQFVASAWNEPLVAAYDPGDTSANYEDCVTLYRKVLAGADAGGVTLVATGFLSCLADLMRSSGDAVSPRTGEELLRAKVAALYVMGGEYPSGAEFNFKGDPEDASYVLSRWKTENGYPAIHFVGFTVGLAVHVGAPPWLPASHPAVYAGALTGERTRPGWDALSVYQAVFGTTRFRVSADGTNVVAAASGDNVWSADVASGHFYTGLARRPGFYAARIEGYPAR